jgi:CubicO group peptidase (beta-lactamase class C family)
MYSNFNFVLLGLIYENITENALEQGWDNLYYDKLNMQLTTYLYPGADADAIIPYNDTWAIFSYSLGLEAP